MSQIAISYRDSPLCADHAHGGGLHAGDRVPDIPVRCHGAPCSTTRRYATASWPGPSDIGFKVGRALFPFSHDG
jgi:hypothetical protein